MNMWTWHMGQNFRADKERICGKCNLKIPVGERFRYSENKGGGNSKVYHEWCIGFIASRYHKVLTFNLNEAEMDWKNYFDRKLCKQLWGV